MFIQPRPPLIDLAISKIRKGETEDDKKTFSDFGGVLYEVKRSNIHQDSIIVSIAMPGFASIRKYELDKLLKKIYSNRLLAQPEAGFDVSVRVPFEPAQDEDQVSLLRSYVHGAPFRLAFNALTSRTRLPYDIMTLQFRPEETVYIKPSDPSDDRVIVIFRITFAEKDDLVLVRTFLQELTEVEKLPVKYDNKPPLELKSIQFRDSDNVEYISFVIFRSNVEGEKLEKMVLWLPTFREYLMYHVKAAKSFMNSRLRARYDSLMQLINRAKPERGPTEKKTSSNRTFARQPSSESRALPVRQSRTSSQ